MAKVNEIDSKEIAVVEKKVNKTVALAESVVVSTDEEMLKAGELRKEIKDLGKEIEARKKEITDPLNKALKSARDLFRPLEDGFATAEKLLTGKMLSYQKKQDDKRKEVEAKTLADLESGKIKESTAEKRLEKAPEPIKRSEDFHTRTVKKFRIVDPLAIPRQYLVPDEVKIRGAMMAGTEVAGVEFYEDKILV